MGGNGFAFAVRVRRQEDSVGFGGKLLQLCDKLFLVRRNDEGGLEGSVLELDTNFVFGQVHDVADGSFAQHSRLPRYLLIVFAFAGDSTITSDLLIFILHRDTDVQNAKVVR